ncbi:MAG: glucose dehydrogenase, partial [Chloroflexi bacterium]|nr:glucose dehydrogenase [Chloroflexota bacterium]
PELDGWYVYGDFCSRHIWAVNTADDSPPVLLAETGLPIASFGELPDGELLALTFANAVFRLTRS